MISGTALERTPRRPRPRAGAWNGSQETLGAALAAHLQEQLESVGRLLELVLEQGGAIRARDVHGVVRLAGMLSGEMSRREQIEERRTALLARSGELLGLAAQRVTLSALCTLMDDPSATIAQELSARLRGLLGELQREHACNRALMHVELSFLDELMRTLALDGVHAYNARGSSPAGDQSRSHGALRVLDLQA